MNYPRVLDEIFGQFVGPKFTVRLWGDQEYTYGAGSLNAFTLVIDDEKTAKRLLAQGAIGFGESYMEGRLRVEGDLEEYLRLRHQFKHIRRSFRLAQATLHANMSVSRNRKDQIAYHYDLGNNFFQMFLDQKTMSYSAGYYITGSEDLGTAQQQKLDLICNSLDLPAGSKVLDLGSGWGGFASHAAEKLHWNLTGYTLSKAQLKYSRRLIKSNHLEQLVSFEYRDMLQSKKTTKFDAIVMIESVEHVGKKRLAAFFQQQHQVLKSDGSLYFQATGRYKLRSVDAWTLKYVFPGGYLPSLGELITAAGEAGFVVEEFRDDTTDYIRTITEWISNLEGHRHDIESKFGESFYRLWELWMHGAKVAFEVNSMSLFRIHLKRPK